ncbi:saccharopine dehydrogenase family protein [Desulfopila aestuarii]|uniref:Saccharopine dehydrogenase, NADP-dependent n=1 Tax=Desulfopila aestuarii DSM 18488 TaxID=1121416 RepID=A0A1M7YKV1_9BACT|nr:saccharopine dehydrogenase C-terminal domain-containing protein [Desulfopila aestuarii]SHO53222.1 Saccharopine dehydrogenase, NADP-dependent [Desulfopila aestuarii DSM 18488]
MKKILVLGLGAQGCAIAKHLNEHGSVERLICADYDQVLAKHHEQTLAKAIGLQVDANDLHSIVTAAEGCSLIVNCLPLEFNLKVMEAALTVNADYMDLAGPMEDIGFVESYKLLFSDWSARFKAKERVALVGCGIAPGLANVIARESVERLDSCDYIGIFFYDGFISKRFIPFWWSPEVALGDMMYKTFRTENGQIVTDIPFSRPIMMKFRGIDREIRMVDHEHDEPVTMGLLAGQVFKGAKNIEFKYGGPQVEMSEYLYKLGMLSKDEVEVNGSKVVPFDLLMKQIPRAPRFEQEIQAVIDEGIVQDEGAFLVRLRGKVNGESRQIDSYTNFPGLKDAFAKAKMTHESYSTGQCAAVFSALMAEGLLAEKGVFVPEQLNQSSRSYVIQELAKLEITIDEYLS